MTIIPSIASADPFNLRAAAESIRDWKYLHLDVEDGNFVPNITFGMKTVCAITRNVPQQCDAHLMTTNPAQYLEPLAEAGVRAVCVHWESCEYPLRILNLIRQHGMRAGIALNPRTRGEVLEAYLSACDYILLMTSEPDAAGERFQISQLEKTRYLRRRGFRGHIILDGGIGIEELPLAEEAGANVVIMGRAVFSQQAPGVFLKNHSKKAEQLWD